MSEAITEERMESCNLVNVAAEEIEIVEVGQEKRAILPASLLSFGNSKSLQQAGCWCRQAGTTHE
jgi:hypothetical protein